MGQKHFGAQSIDFIWEKTEDPVLIDMKDRAGPVLHLSVHDGQLGFQGEVIRGRRNSCHLLPHGHSIQSDMQAINFHLVSRGECPGDGFMPFDLFRIGKVGDMGIDIAGPFVTDIR